MSDDKEKEKDKDVAFTIIDKGTVDRLQKDGQVELPQRKLDIPKDQKWNEKLMGSKLLQSIQSGESPREMSKRMQEVINTNEASAMRLTRTMHTSAENHGRLDSYKNLAEQGVVQKKVWSATPDDRTRPSHIDIDGEEQDIDRPFSNGCMFPGDGKGPSEEVWNCRCAMGDHIIGFKRADGSISYVKYDRDATTHDEQMKAEKERRSVEKKPEKKVVTFSSAVEALKSKHDVMVDISSVKKYKEEAEKNVIHLNKLMDEYNSTTVSYQVVKSSFESEGGGAYTMNGKTSISVQEKTFKIIKATDDLRLGDNQYLGTTYHEFAHSLSQSREKVNPEFWKEMRKLKREYSKDIRFGKEKISTYAEKDVDEFMAEAFTQAKLSNEPSEYSIRALEIIDKYFKR